jgi:hypothetical protein
MMGAWNAAWFEAAATEMTMDTSAIRFCKKCSLAYDWRRSPSVSLKMTYCSSLCERADLGFTIDSLIRTRIQRDPTWGLVPA